MNLPSDMGNAPQLELLAECLRRLLGRDEEGLAAALLPWLTWHHVVAGQILYRRGDVGDEVYFILAGRMRHIAAVADPGGHADLDVARGETFGETEFLAGGERRRGVVAVRDSVLVALSRSRYGDLVHRDPDLSMTVTTMLAGRLTQRPQGQHRVRRPVNICLLAVTEGVDVAGIAYALARPLSLGARVLVVGRDTPRGPNGSLAGDSDLSPDQYRQLTQWLDEVESSHEFLIFLADSTLGDWTRRCLRESDEIVLLAQADRPDQACVTQEQLAGLDIDVAGKRTLALLHDADIRIPTDTREWLARWPAAECLHLRPSRERDIARLARLLSGTAVGVVFSGGGARGFAHLGVLKALEEFGVEVDVVGGASIGAIMGAYCAFDLSADAIIAQARTAFAKGPTRDINLVPLVSLVGGRRLKAVIEEAIVTATGHRIDVEDTWKSFYCVVSNYTRAAETIVTRGDLAKWLRTSVSIPGVLPLIPHGGELMGDGGTFNNFPTDIMRQRGIGYVIGIDLLHRGFPLLDLDEIPGNWQLWRDRLRVGGKGRNRMPGLMSTLVSATMLVSQARQREARQRADLCFTPELKGIGMLDWGKFDTIVELGYRHARAILWSLPEEQVVRLRNGLAAGAAAEEGADDWDDGFIVP